MNFEEFLHILKEKEYIDMKEDKYSYIIKGTKTPEIRKKIKKMAAKSHSYSLFEDKIIVKLDKIIGEYEKVFEKNPKIVVLKNESSYFSYDMLLKMNDKSENLYFTYEEIIHKGRRIEKKKLREEINNDFEKIVELVKC